MKPIEDIWLCIYALLYTLYVYLVPRWETKEYGFTEGVDEETGDAVYAMVGKMEGLYEDEVCDVDKVVTLSYFTFWGKAYNQKEVEYE